MGSGGLTGQGFGQGQQTWKFVPEQHTDFIFSVIGEEFGFVGSVIVLALFAMCVALHAHSSEITGLIGNFNMLWRTGLLLSKCFSQ